MCVPLAPTQGYRGPVPEGDVRLPTLGPWRRRTASGVVATAMSLGLRHALAEHPDDEAVVVDVAGEPHDPAAGLELHFDARGPDDTWVVVRPWLLYPR